MLSCRPAHAEVHLLYGGLSDLLVEHVGEVLPRLPRPQRRAIEVVLLLEGEGPPADQRALAAGVLSTLRELATDRPLLLAIDDAQWLDPASVLVIEYALRRLRDVNMGVLASWRHEPIELAVPRNRDRQLDLGRALGEPPRRLPIGPLSPGAIHQILRNRTGHPFPRPLMRRIYEASGGNPFFALEIARAMDARRDEWTTGEPLALSTSLSELLAERFAGLPKGTRDALFVAAAASQPTLALVEAAVRAPAKPLLDPAVEAGLMRVAEGRIEFGHPLLAAAAYSLPDAANDATGTCAWPRLRPTWKPEPTISRSPGRTPIRRSPSSSTRQPRRLGHGARRRSGRALCHGDRPPARRRSRPPGAMDVEAAPVLRQAGELRRSRALLEGWPASCPVARSGPTCSWPCRDW